MNKLLVFVLSLLCLSAHARPEYAVKMRTVSCRLCHFSPTGGGLRTIVGKQFQSSNRGFSSSEVSGQEQYGGDFRFLFFAPDAPSQQKAGTGLMSAVVSAQLPLEKSIRFVGAFDLGTFRANQRDRELFLIWEKETANPFGSTFLVGKYNLPFGILTDEHRTYTRLLTSTTINDFATGALWSDNTMGLHWDFGFGEGLQSGGSLTTDYHFYGLVNVRGNPSSLPFFWGSSLAQWSSPDNRNPFAASIYSVILLGDTEISVEAVTSKYFVGSVGNSITTFFTGSDIAFANAVKNSQSLGWYALVTQNLSSRWLVQYKFDSLTLDQTFPADSFQRHGLGIKHYITALVNVSLRHEIADNKRDLLDKTVMAAQDVSWMVLQATF